MPDSNRPNYNLKAEDVDLLTSPPIDQLFLWACNVRKKRLVELSDWTLARSETPGHSGPKPSYRLKFDWRDVQSVDEQLETVNAAMERCFGTRSVEGCTLWVTGSQLALVARDFRKEYLKLEERKSTQLALLDIWVDDILEKLKAM